MRSQLALAIALCLPNFGCDSRTHPETIQGKWELSKMNGWFEFDHHLLGKGGLTIFEFIGDQFNFTHHAYHAGVMDSVSGSFNVDGTRNPPEITFRYAERTIVCIFSASESTLRICFGKEDGIPPATFSGGPAERPVLIELRRFKPH
jgi:hypothetical protein